MLAYAWYAILLLVPFNIRYVELVPFALFGLYLYSFGWPRGIWPRALIAFLCFAALSAGIAHNMPAVTGLFWLASSVFLGIVTAKTLRMGSVRFEGVAKILSISAALQSAIGLAQFWKQGGIGLGFLGEAAIGFANPQTAKIVMEGGKLIRASGTLPHANIYAAFLILGLLSLYYLWLRRPSEWRLFSGFRTLLSDASLGLGMFVVWLGLLVSFSRGGWIITALMTVAMSIYGIFSKRYFRQGVRLAILCVAMAGMLAWFFGDYIVPRAQFSAREPSVSLRVGYQKVGFEVIQNNLLGVGIGNQVMYAARAGVFQKFGLAEEWQQQPVHNIYLLIASEIGIVGTLAFIWFLSKILISNFKFQISNLEGATAKTMLVALLLFGLTDHFLWTYPQGRLMLWLTIGIAMGLNMASEERARS